MKDSAGRVLSRGETDSGSTNVRRRRRRRAATWGEADPNPLAPTGSARHRGVRLLTTG
jgi:hypothetical protein